MKSKSTQALVMVALFVVLSVTPTADAWHDVPEPEDTGAFDQPDPLPEDDVETGVIPVDRELERVPEIVHLANEGVNSTYRVVGDGVNAVDDAASGAAQLPLTLYEDGAGSVDAQEPIDSRQGGFSDVEMLGPDSWDHTPQAAFRGAEGYSTPSNSDGTYPGHAEAILVTPELDLRVNALMDARTSSSPVDVGQSSVWTRLYWSCDLVAFAYQTLTPTCHAYRELMEQEDLSISLEYRMRYNLGLGLDGVSVMVFTQEPTTELAAVCTPPPGIQTWPSGDALAAVVSYAGAVGENATGAYPDTPCRIVLPAGGYPTSGVKTMPGKIGYTGYKDWVRDAVDLTPWAGNTSVWVGFYFRSTAIPNPVYFQGESRFQVADAGFFGFHMDDLAVKAVTAPVNLLVRPISEPGQPLIRGVPTLHPDEPTPLRAHIANLGATTTDLTVTTHLLLAGDRSIVHRAPDVSTTLTPGASLDLRHEFDADMLGTGRYVAQFCAYRTGSAAIEGDDGFCETPRMEGDCSGDLFNADPCGQWAERLFEIRELQGITPGAIEIGQGRIETGDTTTLRVPFRNEGNRKDTLYVQAYHVDMSRPNDGLSQEMFEDSPEARDARRITLAPGVEKTLEWEITGGQTVGQFRVVILANSSGQHQPVFHADTDFLPGLIQPWRSNVIDGAGITIDGRLDEPAWLNVPDRPLGTGGGQIQVGNNETHLLLGLKNVESDGLALFLNDLGDDDIDSGGGGLGMLLEDGQVSGFRYDGGWQMAPPSGSIVDVAAGGHHTLVVTDEGSVLAWGRGDDGQLGDGNTQDRSSAVRVQDGEQQSESGFLEDVIAVSAGDGHSLALAADGSVYAWGNGANHRLGDGQTANRLTPVRVLAGEQDSESGFLANVTAVAAGGEHSLALLENGTVYMWGRAASGSSSDGSPKLLRTGGPESDALTNVTAVAAGFGHSLALVEDGTVYGWGDGARGQLGHGAFDDSTVPLAVVSGEQSSSTGLLKNVEAIGAGDVHSFAVLGDGTLLMWGAGSNGRLGNGGTSDQASPVHVTGLAGAVTVTAGQAHSLAVLDDGTVHAWGSDANGRLGDGDENRDDQDTPVHVADLPSVVAVAAGNAHSVAVTEESIIFTWGSNANGRLGLGEADLPNVPMRVLGGDQVGLDPYLQGIVAIEAGTSHSLALVDNGTVLAWGAGGSGRLGTGTMADEPAPAWVVTGAQGSESGLLEDVQAISAGAAHSLALLEDGTVYAWGSGGSGRLGDGSSNTRLTPVQVAGGEQGSTYLQDIIAISAGGSHSLALASDGAVYAWGNGAGGRLGNPGGGSSAVPVRVHGGEQGPGFLKNVVSISAGDIHSMAAADGFTYTWGPNADCRLGRCTSFNGNPVPDEHTPIRASRGGQQTSDSVAVSAFARLSVILGDDDRVYTMGPGGQLGDGRTNARAGATLTYRLHDAVAIAAGSAHGMAMTESGLVYSWGSDSNGQLGISGVGNQLRPLRVLAESPSDHGFLADVVGIAAGGTHSMALRGDGSVYAWGNPADGRLGTGASQDQPAPVRPESTTFESWGFKGQTDGQEYELAIPINGGTDASVPSLTAEPGENVGFALRFCATIESGLPCPSYPTAVPVHDGDGFEYAEGGEADGLADELRHWQTIAIGDPKTALASGTAPFADVVVGPGFGVGSVAPPYFLEDFSDCSKLEGWWQARGEPWAGLVDKWNCGDYGDDGRRVLHKGVVPGTDCGDELCLPYAGIPGAIYAPHVNPLWTPPVTIPPGADEPTVLLAHQYSTDVALRDVWGLFGRTTFFVGQTGLNHLLSISLESWDADAGEWIDLGRLEPNGGYSTEQSTGIHNDEIGPRTFSGTDSSPPREWWWPQGEQVYRKPGEVLSRPTHFLGGSPWTTDIVPLYGTHFEDAVNVRGQTVRLRFDVDAAALSRHPEIEMDWGWRIGSMAIVEGDRFPNDIAVEAVDLGLIYDPGQRGLGPGTAVPVTVTVRNVGIADANNVEAELVGRNVLTGDVVCTDAGRIPETILADDSYELTLVCPLPSPDGGEIPRIQFLANAWMPEDEFPGNNHQRGRGVLDLKASPDAAVFVEASPVNGAIGDDRRIDLEIQNLGNVPLSDLAVRIEVTDLSDPGNPQKQVLDETTGATELFWLAGQAVPVQEEPVFLRDLIPEADPRFTPPTAGTYEIQATIFLPGTSPNDLTQPTARILVHASERMYSQDFDSPVLIDERTLDGELRVLEDPDLHGTDIWSIRLSNGVDDSVHLHAGDELGDLAPNADAIVELPSLDMAALRDATLTFRHRYDLETGFDVGRVEMSVDGGDSWNAVVPQPQPIVGLPDGYPSETLAGVTAILGDEAECFACGFTGNSEDLPGADEEGWVTAQFDLAQQADLFVNANIDPFPVEGIEPRAQPEPVTLGQPHTFVSDDWAVEEAPENERSWWINATYHRLEDAGIPKDGGWYIGDVEGPPWSPGPTAAWRFNETNSDIAKGYPVGVDSRLVTPVVDLRTNVGESVSLHFDHKYQLDGYHDHVNQHGSPLVGRPNDGAAVAYQVFDPATGDFGPWRLLGARPTPPELGFYPHSVAPFMSVVGAPGERFAMGYPAVYLDPSATPSSPAFMMRSVIEEGGFGVATFLQSFVPTTVGYAFSGDSEYLLPDGEGGWTIPRCDVNEQGNRCTGRHPESRGWQRVEWDISHLLGTQVRFAFHASTLDREGMGCSPFNRVGCPETPAGGTGPPRDGFVQASGWTVANVEVRGKQYQGDPVQLRFRLATDGSMSKGGWSIDDIAIVGQRYQNATVVLSDQPYVLDLPGETVTLEGAVRNLGATDRTNLAVAIHADRSDPAFDDPFRRSPVDVNLLHSGDMDFLTDTPGIPDGAAAWGPFELRPGASRPLPVQIPELPNGTADLRVQILQCTEPQAETCPSYAPIRNERGVGLPAAAWTAVGDLRTDLQFVPPVPGRATVVVAEPAVPPVGETMTLRAAAFNNGTTVPNVRAEWVVEELLRKGGSADQPGTFTKTADEKWPLTPTDLGAFGRSETLRMNATFIPPREGVYLATIKLLDTNDTELAATSFEFLAGTVKPYYLVDFAQEAAPEAGWANVNPADHNQPSSSPHEIEFRHDGARFIWGVSAQEDLAGLDYCSAGGCNPPNPSGDNEVGTVYGLHGIAESPLIDLGRVVGDRATLTLRQGHRFTPGDGAAVEALPLSAGRGNPNAFECKSDDGNVPAWFRLTPEETDDLRGETFNYVGYRYGRPPPPGTAGQTKWEHVPHRENALDYPHGTLMIRDTPIIGGLPGVDEEVLLFDLNTKPQAICPRGYTFEAEEPPSLLNYTVQLRLRAATTPGLNDPMRCEDHVDMGFNARGCPDNPRTGSLGWQVDSLGITSVEVQASPADREVPMRDGYVKRFNLLVTNHGPLEETFHVGLGPENLFQANTSWFTFPQPEVTLAPGESRVVPFDVFIPIQPPVERGRHSALLRVTSGLDPNLFDDAIVNLKLDDHPLPDLAVRQMEIQPQEEGDPVEPGKVAHVVTTIVNEGTVGYRDEVSLPITSSRIDENGTVLGSALIRNATVPPLEPGERHTIFAEWVPHTIGTYRIEAVADPEGRLLQTRVSNDKASRVVEVVPLQRPDVRVADLSIQGVEADGYALDGSLLTIVATITNLGNTVATDAQVSILAGGAQLVDATLDSIAPGERRNVTALRIASPGEVVVRALVIPGLGPENRGDDFDEMRRILRVRGIDLEMAAVSETLALAPGKTATTRVDLNNSGNAVEKVVFSLAPEYEGWGIAATPNPVTVAPNATGWSIITLKAPEDALAGEYNVTVLASPQSQPAFKTKVEIPVNVSARIDRPVAQVLDEIEGPPGPATMRVLIESRSNTEEDVTVLLADPSWSASPKNVTLTPRNQIPVNLALTIPPHTPPGPVPTRVVVRDANGDTLMEVHGTLNVTAQPDGIASWGPPSRGSVANLTVRVFHLSLNVTNTGNVPFEATGHVNWLSDGADVEFGPPIVVQPGTPGQLNVTARVNHEFTGHVHGHVAIYMHSMANASTKAVRQIAALDLPDLAPVPDLAITSVAVQPRGVVETGRPVKITATVENLGFVNVSATELYGYVNGQAVNVYAVESIEPGDEAEVNITWEFRESGSFLIHLIADGSGDVEELHDDNNGWTYELVVESGGFLERAQEVPAVPVIPFLAMLWVAGWLAGRRRHQP